jgi:hypothetical protein
MRTLLLLLLLKLPLLLLLSLLECFDGLPVWQYPVLLTVWLHQHMTLLAERLLPLPPLFELASATIVELPLLLLLLLLSLLECFDGLPVWQYPVLWRDHSINTCCS